MDDLKRVITLLEGLKAALEARTVQPRLLTVKQTAIYLGRTETATRQLQYSGGLPCVRADGRVMFDIRDLDRWIESNKTKG